MEPNFEKIASNAFRDELEKIAAGVVHDTPLVFYVNKGGEAAGPNIAKGRYLKHPLGKAPVSKGVNMKGILKNLFKKGLDIAARAK